MNSRETWTTLASEASIIKTVENLEKRGIVVKVVENATEALAELKSMITPGVEVATGTSTTLNEIGFTGFLTSEESKADYMSPKIWAENDPVKRLELRKKAVTADLYFASPNAISENGEIVSVDATGSRVGAMPYAASKVVLVASTQKITPNLEAAMQRVREHVFTLEDARALKAYGAGSSFGKWVIIEKEVTPDRILVILVKEKLGF